MPRTATGGVRLVLPLRVGTEVDVIELEAAHVEWLVRTAAYVAVRDGLLGMPETVFGSVRPAAIKTWHGSVRCLDALAIELRDERGRQVSRTEFPRHVLEPFVTARAVHRIVESGAEGRLTFASSLHAIDADEDPLPVSVPALPAWSIDDLASHAVAEGSPARQWIATFVGADVVDGLGLLEQASRETGVEAAGRIHARVGFDRKARTFIRVLERLIVTRDAVATGSTIVSSGASWGDFLAAAPTDRPTVASRAHTHIHCTETAADEHSEAALDPRAKPMISIADRVTSLTLFNHPLSGELIVSLYPDGRVVKLYGYTPGGTFEEEPGYWVLPPQQRRTGP